MNKLYSLVFASLLIAAPVFADTCSVSLMPPFTPAQAKKICGTFGAGYIGTLANNTYINARNAADSANIELIKVDANDETVLNSDSGDSIHLQVGGDAQRLYNFTAASDTALNLTWGDSGTTATQVMSVTASNSDADDDSSLALAAGGGGLTTDGSRGGIIVLRGNEVASSGGSISVLAGNASTANINLNIEDSSSNVHIKDTTTGTLWSFTDAGNLVADATNAGSIVMAKAATGAIIGEATRAANVTTITQLAVPLYVSAAGSGTDLAAFISSGASATGANVDFFKTRASSGAATTIVSSGDVIGSLRFYGANGTTYDPAATIVASVSTTPGASTDMPGKLVFNLSPDSSVTPAAVLTLDQDKSALFTGTVRSSATTTIGWSLVTGANTACNTTCTSACVLGQNTATFALVDCADATADACICAGAS